MLLIDFSPNKPDEQRTQNAADEVHGDHVERIVVPEHLLGPQGEVTDERRRDADGDCRQWC